MPGIRLAEVVAALSLATDLGMGQPMEQALRTCLVATRIGNALGLTTDALRTVYYVSALRWVGCTADAHELSSFVGDEIEARAHGATADFGSPADMLRTLARVGHGRSLAGRARTLATMVVAGRRMLVDSATAHCEIAQLFATRLGLGTETQRALGDIFERWDGGGQPAGRRGADIAPAARIAYLARDIEIFHRLGGVDSAVSVARRRAGRAYDPELVERFCAAAPGILGGLDTNAWEATLGAEPAPWRVLSGPEIDAAAEVFADFVDLKTVYTAGHSRGVAALAADAAARLRLPEPDVAAVRRAALLHDIGRTGIPDSIWEKPGTLTVAEWERVRLHPYLTERVLARPAAFAEVSTIAGLHHERLDGTGYVRGAHGDALPLAARILAAADAYHAMTEPRPYRGAMPAAEAAAELEREIAAGRLDADAAGAVLAAAGQRRSRREPRTALSPREIEVLRLVVRGASNKEVAHALEISASTVHHHVQHIYDKIGVSSRAAAALYATQRGLIGSAPDETA